MDIAPLRRLVRNSWQRLLGPVRFDGPLEAEYLVDFEHIGRRSRSELWIILVVCVAAALMFNRVVLDVPAQIMPLSRFLAIGVLVPMVLRWLSGDRSPLRRWSSVLFIVSVYIDIGAMMVLRVACLGAGIDAVPLIMPVAVLMSLIVVQIRFTLLAPAILLGLLELVAIELWAFEPNSNRLFDVAATFALVTVALTAAYSLESWTRIGWLRQRELDALARTDPLTGLANRRHFEEALHAAVGSADGASLMMIDVDRFKSYNDSYGHLAGDRCLAAVGKYLVEEAGSDGFVARLGGEEFAVIWRHNDPTRAERLRSGLSSLVLEPQPGVTTGITASAGFAAVAPDRGEADVFKRADAALYAAKRGGRDRLVADTGRGDDPGVGADQSRVRLDGRSPVEPSETGTILVRPLRFDDEAVEAEFRAVFDAEGRTARRFIMVGLLCVIAALLAFATPLLKLPPEADRLGRLTLIFGLTPGALLALTGNTWTRLNRWAPQLYIVGVAVILTAQLYERVIQLPLGYDVVPFIMPLSVLLSLTVVQIRFSMLVPATVAATVGVVTVEIAAFPITGNRLLMVVACIVMVSVTLRFSYKLERTRRLSWLTDRRLDALTRSDPLTGLANRRHLDESLRDMHDAATRDGGKIVFMLLDIDEFKAFNDTFGHLAGDQCLRRVGDYLAEAMMSDDGVAARLGGEEFAVAWIDKTGRGTDRAEQIRHSIATLGVTASAGIVLAAANGGPTTLVSTLQRADAALYEAKHTGRNRSVVTAVERQTV